MSNRSSKKKEVDLALKQPGTKVDSKPKKSASKTPTKISNQGPSEGEAEKPKKISYKVMRSLDASICYCLYLIFLKHIFVFEMLLLTSGYGSVE